MTSDRLDHLIEAATAADGQPPFSDQSLVDLTTGARRLLTVPDDGDLLGAALVTVSAEPSEAELVVHPDARRRGLGEQLLQRVLGETSGELLIWAHGDHPAARVLAERHGLEPVRQLLQLRLHPVPEVVEAAPAAEVRAFRPGTDDAAWIELNAAAFSEHPEQGRLTQRDLDARKAEDWFDADDFLLLWDGEQLIGFCWLKVDGDVGEFYAVGVHPGRQGEGIGRTLVEAGLRRLAERDLRSASLYVEADNEPAVRLYRSYGFRDHTIDIQYRR